MGAHHVSSVFFICSTKHASLTTVSLTMYTDAQNLMKSYGNRIMHKLYTSDTNATLKTNLASPISYTLYRATVTLYTTYTCALTTGLFPNSLR